jgi:hypothetical protein
VKKKRYAKRPRVEGYQRGVKMGSIDVMDTEIGVKLRKARLLSEAVAWYDSMDFTTRKMILDWIQIDQLTGKGIDSDGDELGTYSFLTEILSGGRKKFGDHYTLNDTGAFYRGMFVVVLKDSFVVDSDQAVKEDGTNLFYKYGDNIVGLTDENLAKLIAVLREKYIAFARRMLDID